MYFFYLDEFGHIGPFVKKKDPQYYANPVFGLGGFGIPATKVRIFSKTFYELKVKALQRDIDKSKLKPGQFEKKGSELFRTKNIAKYSNIRGLINSIFNLIDSNDGIVFYNGLVKSSDPEHHNSKGVYINVLKNSVKSINKYCEEKSEFGAIFLDEIEPRMRTSAVEVASVSLYGYDRCFNILEPPYQVESHLYQTVQCADWICAILGRLFAYEHKSDEFPKEEVFKRYFSDRLKKVSKNSSIQRTFPRYVKVISRP